MTDETKKIFSAPWEIEQNMDVFELYNCKDLCSFACTDEKNAHRFVRLPELYEELKSASYVFCWSCLATLGIDPPTADELVENLCPRKPSFCGYNNRWKLLRKVRDGE